MEETQAWIDMLDAFKYILIGLFAILFILIARQKDI